MRLVLLKEVGAPQEGSHSVHPKLVYLGPQRLARMFGHVADLDIMLESYIHLILSIRGIMLSSIAFY